MLLVAFVVQVHNSHESVLRLIVTFFMNKWLLWAFLEKSKIFIVTTVKQDSQKELFLKALVFKKMIYQFKFV